MIYGGACPNPFDNPLLLGNPYPYSLNSPLTYLESLLCVVVRSLSALIPGWLYTDPPLPPHSLSPFPNSSPFQMHALLRRHCDIGFT